MASPLTNLQVFSRWTYLTATEILDQQIALFNAATRGGIILRAERNVGDFTDAAFWAKVQGMVRRRDAYGDGPVEEVNLQHLLDTSVKVAAGTPPIRIDPGMFEWIQRDPAEAGVVIGRQLAPDLMADMLNTGILVFATTHAGDPDVTASYPEVSPSPLALNAAAAKFGDRSQALVCWVMHSVTAHSLYANAIMNMNALFSYETINVRQDGFGRIFVISDSPSLVVDNDANPDTYLTLGLAPGAVYAEQNGDFFANIETKNGFENIQRTYQAEWSYNVGVKGFSWDKSSKSPTTGALASEGNWDRYATSHKDLGGVVLETAAGDLLPTEED